MARNLTLRTTLNGTTRLQTVSRKTNPRYWQLIRAFESLTCVPVLLNTSFNVQESILCGPEDAIQTFQNARFKALVCAVDPLSGFSLRGTLAS